MQPLLPITFYFLCSNDRKYLYESSLSRIAYKFVFFDNVRELIRVALGAPPTAIFVDIQTSIRAGINDSETFNNLYVVWPVLRCTVSQSGFATAVSNTPPRRDAIDVIVPELIANYDQWKNEAYHRQHVRIDVECRMKIRKVDSKFWARANCQNISSGGFFAVTYEPPEKGCDVEIQLQDLSDDTIVFTARSVWSRKWDDTTQLPGLGIAIDSGHTNPAFMQALQSPKFVKSFLKD